MKLTSKRTIHVIGVTLDVTQMYNAITEVVQTVDGDWYIANLWTNAEMFAGAHYVCKTEEEALNWLTYQVNLRLADELIVSKYSGKLDSDKAVWIFMRLYPRGRFDEDNEYPYELAKYLAGKSSAQPSKSSVQALKNVSPIGGYSIMFVEWEWKDEREMGDLED